MKKVQFCFAIQMICLILLGFWAVASATPVLYWDVSNSQDEKDGPVANDNGYNNDSADVLNDYRYFGKNEWELLSKIGDENEEKVDIDLTATGTNGGSFGTWSFSTSVWDNYSHVIIVLKDGLVPKEKDLDQWKWAAWLLNTSVSSGTWDMIGGPDGDPTAYNKQNSHLSVYGSKVSVPEPTTLLLLGLGLVGMASLRKKLR